MSLLVVVAGLLAGAFLQVLRTRTMSHWKYVGVDLHMRLNEAECVMSGVDPYLVWSGRIPTDRYVPWEWRHLANRNVHDRLIHSYPPWSYAYVMPLAALPRRIAVACYAVLQVLVVLGICAYAWRIGYVTAGRSIMAGLAFLAAALSLSASVCACLLVMNYGILIAGSVLLAIVCHRRGHDCIAGLFWGFSMVKPQIGLVFTIPLLFQRKWKTLAVEGGVLLAATLVSSAFCCRSPIAMVLAVLDYSAGQFCRTGLFGHRLLALSSQSCWAAALSVCNAVAVIGLCSLCSFFLRRERDSLIWSMPALFLSTLFLASRSHDFAVWMIGGISLAYSAVVLKMRIWGYVSLLALCCTVIGGLWPDGNDFVCWSSLAVCLTLPIVCRETWRAERRV